PAAARNYLKRIEEIVGTPIDLISTGAERDETIILRHPFEKDGGASVAQRRMPEQ
ncbi:MAG: adenylosuccinate synthetase, partial [Acidiferrobacteraceae bacterium]